MGRWDDWAADVRQRREARRAEWARTGEQQKTEALKKLGERDDLPVEALDHVAYLVDAFNEYGVPDLNKVPEASRELLESTLKRRGWHYHGGSK
ncbi:hypothetical protein F7P69_01365 [Cellulosimicrobium funkei]|nr:hypothetical protein [Cellulosimicrobium funkei]